MDNSANDSTMEVDNNKNNKRDDDDADDGDTDCNWYTRQKNQPSLTKSMPLQQPTQDTRSLAYDTVVEGNNGGIKTNRTIADMDDDHDLT
jgi:hypothetical protein